jgi:hypothetical protein
MKLTEYLGTISRQVLDDLFGEYMGAALINSSKGVFLAAANDFDCDLVDNPRAAETN